MAREDQEAQRVLGSFLLVFSSIPLSGPAVYLDLKETSKFDLLISPVKDWPSVHSVSLTKTLGLALVSLQLLRILEKGWICLLLQCFVLLLSFRHKTARYSQYSKPESYYGANFVPIFIKQIQCFANSKLNLRENVEVWTNICIVCYNCDTHLPFYVETWLDFLTRAIEQLSFPKTADDVCRFMLVSRNTSLPFQSNVSGNMWVSVLLSP